jgi:hypothetical protein
MKGIRVGELSVISTPVKIQRIHTRNLMPPRLVIYTVTWEQEAKMDLSVLFHLYRQLYIGIYGSGFSQTTTGGY